MDGQAICQSCSFELRDASEMGVTADGEIQPLNCRNCMPRGIMHFMLRRAPFPLFVAGFKWALRKGLHPSKGKVVDPERLARYAAALSSLPWWSAKAPVKRMRRGDANQCFECQVCGRAVRAWTDLGRDAGGHAYPQYCRRCFSNGAFSADVKGLTVEEYSAAQARRSAAAGTPAQELEQTNRRYRDLLYWKQIVVGRGTP